MLDARAAVVLPASRPRPPPASWVEMSLAPEPHDSGASRSDWEYSDCSEDEEGGEEVG